ncbi:hypothetical protein [Rugamonas sp.]|uniref:hypothetical protein n=1 Tax=Rugamonas sp. TaxID=1926287 RepID=UPI0025DF5C9B|nr:hypothetical protein [Rugamonas sp.]
MNVREIDRLAAVRSLLDFSLPLQDSLRQLASLDWDYEGAAATLRKEHIAAVLARYRAGQLGAADIEAWADAVEGRDDIDFEMADARLLKDLIFELANPLLTHALNQTRAADLLARLLRTAAPTARHRP